MKDVTSEPQAESSFAREKSPHRTGTNTMAPCLTPVEMEGLLANSLSPADKAHLAECEQCRKALHEKRDQDHLFKDLQQAYAESTTGAEDRDASKPSMFNVSNHVRRHPAFWTPRANSLGRPMTYPCIKFRRRCA